MVHKNLQRKIRGKTEPIMRIQLQYQKKIDSISTSKILINTEEIKTFTPKLCNYAIKQFISYL